MLKLKQNILTILDICSSKVICIIAKFEGKRSEILGIGHVKSEGIRAGIVSDVELAQQAVKKAVEDAEKAASIKVGKVFVCISSNYLISQCLTTEIATISRSITHRELNKLLLDAIQICKNQNLEIIHTFACNYILDGQHGISNPIGMFGNRLSCNFHILSVAANSLLNIQTVISKAGLEVDSYVAGIYSSGLCVLSKDEVETGAILVDFGAEVTSIGVFENEQLIYADAIPIGGKHITADIAKVLCISKVDAERIKNLYGIATKNDVDLNELIEIKNNNERSMINHNELIEVIHARLEEILHILRSKTAEFKINNVVITGGGARMPLLKEVLSETLHCKVRIGYPQNINVKSHNLELSSAIGVINHITDNIQENHIHKVELSENINIRQKFLNWLKKTFF